MRIALVIYGSLETVSGGYLYDRKLVDQLRARGHSVEIVALPWRNYAAHLMDNASMAWRRRVRALDVDLVLEDELNHPSLVFAPRPAPANGAQPRIVTIVHHLRTSEEQTPWLRPFYRAVEAHYLRRADGFIFNSRTTHASVEALRPALPPHIIAYPAGDHALCADYLSLREDYGHGAPDTGAPPALPHAQPQDTPPLRAAFVGSLIPRKGLHTLITALAAADAPIMLDIAGSETTAPDYAARMRAQVQAAGLADRVHFLGALSDADRAALYARSDLFVLPSYEGFGIVYLEAMAYGLPVIASTTGAAHEIVNAGDNGFLVAPNDAPALARYMTALARDRALLSEMSAAARTVYAAFPTWEQSTTRTCQFLEELVAQ